MQKSNKRLSGLIGLLFSAGATFLLRAMRSTESGWQAGDYLCHTSALGQRHRQLLTLPHLGEGRCAWLRAEWPRTRKGP